MSTVSDALDDLYNEIANLGLEDWADGIGDDEDMTVYAIRFLQSNLDHFVEEIEGEEDESQLEEDNHVYEHQLGRELGRPRE